MKRIALILSVLLTITSFANAAVSSKSNLLIIQTDEHNFRTLGCYRELMSKKQAYIWGDGVTVETPNLDWLAKNGAIADRFYATSPVCTPSRAAFVTGRFPQNTGAISNNLPLRDDMVTFAEVLRRNGYATGFAGKWHLDGDGKPQWAPARKFGFEDNRYMFNRGHWKKVDLSDQGPRIATKNKRGQPNYDVAGADEKSFTTDFLANRAIDFIKQNKGNPFCYYVSIPDPHGPNTVRAPYDTMYLDLKFKQPRTALIQGEKLPAYASTRRDQFKPVLMARYFGMVKCIDDNVGRILDAMRSEGILERTIVVFTSDHGDFCGEHGRHNKGLPGEASSRIPFLIYAPDKIKPGTVVHSALSTVDFKPTILSLMGIDNPGHDEGRNASHLFVDEAKAEGWQDTAFIRIGTNSTSGWMGAFSRRYKLVVSPTAPASLFDLQVDPDELKNFINSPEYRNTIRQLARELAEYAQRRKDPLWESSAIRADLDWAIGERGDYTPVKRDGAPKGNRTRNTPPRL